MRVVPRSLSLFEVNAGKFPQSFAIASFSICKPADELCLFHPLPSSLGSLLKQMALLFSCLCAHPITAFPFNEVNRPTFRGFGGEGSHLHECRPHLLQV